MIVQSIPYPAGGGAATQFETLGNAYSSNPGAGASTASGVLIPITPAQSCVLSKIVLGVQTSTGQSAKALVYADNAGAPGALIAVGTATGLGSVTSTLVELPFAASVSLTGGVTYWVGYVPSASISFSDVTLAGIGTTASTASVTYASPQADLTGLSTPGASKPVICAPATFTAALSGVDIIAQSENIFHSNTSQPTWINIPKGGVGDIAYLQVAPTNGGPPSVTTPSGWTLISSPMLNGNNFNGKNNIFRRVLDGTENGIVAFTSSSYSVIEAKMAVVRGMDTTGTPEKGLVTSTGSGASVVSPAITTTAPDQLALNFFAAGAANGTDLTGAADAWTDYYDHSTTLGTDAAISLTYRDAPTATTLSTETRTNAAAGSTYAVVGFALQRLS